MHIHQLLPRAFSVKKPVQNIDLLFLKTYTFKFHREKEDMPWKGFSHKSYELSERVNKRSGIRSNDLNLCLPMIKP